MPAPAHAIVGRACGPTSRAARCAYLGEDPNYIVATGGVDALQEQVQGSEVVTVRLQHLGMDAGGPRTPTGVLHLNRRWLLRPTPARPAPGPPAGVALEGRGRMEAPAAGPCTATSSSSGASQQASPLRLTEVLSERQSAGPVARWRLLSAQGIVRSSAMRCASRRTRAKSRPADRLASFWATRASRRGSSWPELSPRCSAGSLSFGLPHPFAGVAHFRLQPAGCP